ncbi:Hypothetical protein HVR_LOCUS111 [uncultured virus]|nr:Hypothetical protein HVR_LOCUS111 [uncultured virus]
MGNWIPSINSSPDKITCCKSLSEYLELSFDIISRNSWQLSSSNEYTIIKLSSFEECHHILGHDICKYIYGLCHDYRTILILNILSYIVYFQQKSSLNYKSLDISYNHDNASICVIDSNNYYRIHPRNHTISIDSSYENLDVSDKNLNKQETTIPDWLLFQS